MNSYTSHIAHIKGQLVVSTTLLKEAGVSEKTIESASARKSKKWCFHKVPGVKTMFVEWEPLDEDYRTRVEKYLKCTPKDHLEAEKIKAMLKRDNAAETFFNFTYKTACGDGLSDELKDRYKTAAKWLNLFDDLVNKRTKVDKSLLKSLRAEKWAAFRGLLETEKVALPTGYNPLMIKLRNYTAGRKRNYKVLISGKVDNQNSRKVKEGICLDLLLEMIANHKQFDCPEIQEAYNQWAKENNYKEISRTTVNHYWQQYDQVVRPFRESEQSYHVKIDKVIHRNRPKHPLYLINHDDNDLDLHFYEFTPGEGGKYSERFVLIVLVDAYNNYPLGYSYSLGSPTVEQIKAAYLDAVHHIHDLTGEWAVWHEAKSDRFGYKSLKPWIEQHAHFTPAKAKVARGKVIEQSFGKGWHKKLKRYDNYTGHNITAKNRGINPDFVRKAKKYYPEVESGLEQIAHFIQRVRTDKKPNGKSLQEKWLEAFKAMPQSEKRIMSHEERLLWFGISHDETIELRNTGIVTRIMGGHIYDVKDEDYKRHIGKSFQLIYDPYLPEMALVVTDEGRVRLLVKEYDRVPMDLRSREEGDAKRIVERLDEKREMNQWVIDERARRKENIKGNGINVNGLLQGMDWTKEVKMSAERSYLEQEVYQMEREKKPRQLEANPEDRALEDL